MGEGRQVVSAVLSVLKALAVIFLAATGARVVTGAFLPAAADDIGAAVFLLLGSAFLYRAWFLGA